MQAWLKLVAAWHQHRVRLLTDVVFYVCGLAVLFRTMLAITSAQQGLCSDDLWLGSFFHDLSIGNPIRHWRLPPAPIYFPEGIWVGAGMALGFDLDAVYISYGVASWSCVALITAWGIRLFGADTKRAGTAVALVLLFYGAISNGTAFTTPLTNPASHGGAFLCTFFWLVFIAEGIESGFRRAPSIVATVLLALCIGSDRSVLAHFVAPAVVVIAVFISAGCGSRRRWGVALGLMAVATPLGLALPSLITWATGVTVAPVHINVSWEHSVAMLRECLEDMKQLATEHPVLFWVNAACVAGTGMHVVSNLGKRAASTDPGEDRALGRWWVSSASLAIVGSTVAVAVVSSHWVAFGGERYLLPLTLLPVAAAAIVFVPSLPALGAELRRGVELAVLGACVLMSANYSSASYVERQPYSLTEAASHQMGHPEVSRACLAGEVARSGLHAGYAMDRYARPSMMIEGSRINMSHVSARLKVRHWINNASWYTRGYWPTPEGGLHHDFLIANDLDEDWLTKRFGEPRAVRQCFRIAIWIYDRASDVEFRNYIRTEVAQLTGDFTGWWESNDLRRDRPNPDTAVIVPPERGLALRFERVPAHLVEIVNPSRKPLRLGFYVGGEEVAADTVDFTVDQRRIVRLPAAAQGKLDALVIRPAKGGWAEILALSLMSDSFSEAAELTELPRLAR